MFEFPLCCLSYPSSNKLDLNISYCIVEHSKKIESKIDSRISELDKYPSDFNRKNEKHKKILLAGDELGVILGSVTGTIANHNQLSSYINNFKIKHGKDSYCRVGKKLLFEVRDSQFDYRSFSVLCAIQSILGKSKKFKRITKDRIRYAMLGYKSKAVALAEMTKGTMLLTDRQIGTVVEVLHAKKFFSKFTYANRQTFFSTRLSNDELYKAVKNAKIFWAEKKANLMDKQVSGEIKKEIGNLRLIKLYPKTGS